MTKQDRTLKNLSFPAQSLEIEDSILNALQGDADQHNKKHSADELNFFEQTIDGKQFQHALTSFLTICPPEQLPIALFMKHFPLTSNGSFGMLMLTSATFGEAIQDSLVYFPLVMPAFSLSRIDVGDQVHLVYKRLYDFGTVNDFLTEAVVLTALKIRLFMSKPVSHSATIHLCHAPMGELDAYEEAFHCKFVFNSKQNKFVFARKDLDIPLLTASSVSHALIRAQLQEQSRMRSDLQPITLQVKRLLQQALKDNQVIDAIRVSHALLLSQRTLSRRLQAEGTTLSQLKVEASVEYSQLLLLESNKAITEIARRVGFTDVTSFTRAFKRLTGKTPSQFKTGHI